MRHSRDRTPWSQLAAGGVRRLPPVETALDYRTQVQTGAPALPTAYAGAL